MNENEDLIPKTRRDILMCRDAAVRAIEHSERYGRKCAYPESCAAALFPLPKKSVPRTIVVGSLEYRFVDGGFQFRWLSSVDTVPWMSSATYTPEQVKALNDLIASPTVEVDDD